MNYFVATHLAYKVFISISCHLHQVRKKHYWLHLKVVIEYFDIFHLILCWVLHLNLKFMVSILTSIWDVLFEFCLFSVTNLLRILIKQNYCAHANYCYSHFNLDSFRWIRFYFLIINCLFLNYLYFQQLPYSIIYCFWLSLLLSVAWNFFNLSFDKFHPRR